MFCLSDNLDTNTGSEVNPPVSRMPAKRREKAPRYHFPISRKLCAVAYSLLWRGFQAAFGINEQPPFDDSPNKTPYKPSLPKAQSTQAN